MTTSKETAGPPAVFLDRDGVLIENRNNYIRSWEDVEIFGQAVEALRGLAGGPYLVILVTNQSVVGRGLVPDGKIESISRRLVEEIRRRGGRIDDVFICPHAPEDDCACRKPLPGLIYQAVEAYGIDLARSIMIGDAVTDLQAAKAAGIPVYALVRTGRGRDQEKLLGDGLEAAGVFEDLRSAIKDLVPARSP